MKEEHEKRSNFSKSRSENRLKGIENQKNKTKKKKKSSYDNHMEDVNENEIINYFTTNGYNIESAKKFFNFYSVAKWKDSNGNQVKNWKQKAQGVWFKEENKIVDKSQPKMVY
jgi:hypothetical protein